ncbi:hypothetical protein Bca4012_052250 [Brassica carinata]
MDCPCTDFGQLMHNVSTHISTLALPGNCSCTDLDMSSILMDWTVQVSLIDASSSFNELMVQVRSERRFCRMDLANDTCLWEPKQLLRVGNRAASAYVASSPDSDLEAFSHYPAHCSFAPLAFQPSARTNCANQRFLLY